MRKILTKEDFNAFAQKQSNKYKKPLAFGIARADRGQKNSNKILQASFGMINWNENFGSYFVFMKILKELKIDIDFSESEFVCDVSEKFVKKAYKAFKPFLDDEQKHLNVEVIKYLKENFEEKRFRFVALFKDEAPKSVEAVYLKLYALSSQKVALRSLNLDGAFGILENVAWSGRVPYELAYLQENEIPLKLSGTYPNIDFVDKFPRYLQHIVCHESTRILDSSKARMGASLANGTTLMPGASYINFNAGTLGAVMVEGRISSSAIVGKGSDVGGGASILGVLSGTNGNAISIGENTLLGANSVTGIPLGDACIVDAGIAILEGTKISIKNAQAKLIKEANPNLDINLSEDEIILKGLELANCNGVHFRQNSMSGKIEAYRSKREVKLNQILHG